MHWTHRYMPKGVGCSVDRTTYTATLSGCNAKVCGHARQDMLMASSRARVRAHFFHTLIHSFILNLLFMSGLIACFWVYYGCIYGCMGVYCNKKAYQLCRKLTLRRSFLPFHTPIHPQIHPKYTQKLGHKLLDYRHLNTKECISVWKNAVSHNPCHIAFNG